MPAFDGFEGGLAYLDSLINYERTRPSRVGQEAFKLDRMRALLDALGNPERSCRFVHVAGSKGKGSTVEMIQSCLSACQYAVGVFTSPHLVDVRERIRIGSEWIDAADFARLLSDCGHAAAGLPRKHGAVTYFEMLTALGLCYFAEQAVDIAIIEVGLGGRLDSTNVIMPEVACVTAIQLEHTEILGDTLAKIAAEKAGIFKPGVPALTMEQAPEVMDVFKAKAEEVGCPLLVLGQDIEFTHRFESSPELGPHVRVSLTSPRSNYEHLPVPLKGHHQAHNCGLALAVLDKLRERGFDAPEREVAVGLAETPGAGRLELVWTSPRILLDGAHTPDSVEALMRAIGSHMRYDSMVAIVGVPADKDVDGILDRIAIGADKVIFTKAQNNPRAADPEDLERRFRERHGKMTQVCRTLKDAINAANRAVGRDDLIVITGSFYLVGEAKKLLAEADARRKAESR